MPIAINVQIGVSVPRRYVSARLLRQCCRECCAIPIGRRYVGSSRGYCNSFSLPMNNPSTAPDQPTVRAGTPMLAAFFASGPAERWGAGACTPAVSSSPFRPMPLWTAAAAERTPATQTGSHRSAPVAMQRAQRRSRCGLRITTKRSRARSATWRQGIGQNQRSSRVVVASFASCNVYAGRSR